MREYSTKQRAASNETKEDEKKQRRDCYAAMSDDMKEGTKKRRESMMPNGVLPCQMT